MYTNFRGYKKLGGQNWGFSKIFIFIISKPMLTKYKKMVFKIFFWSKFWIFEISDNLKNPSH